MSIYVCFYSHSRICVYLFLNVVLDSPMLRLAAPSHSVLLTFLISFSFFTIQARHTFSELLQLLNFMKLKPFLDDVHVHVCI